MSVKKLSLSVIGTAAILAVSLLFYIFLGQAAYDKDPKNIIFYFTVLYGIVPIFIGIILKLAAPERKQMLVLSAVSLLSFALIVGASRPISDEVTFFDNFIIMLVPFAFLLPAVFTTYALLKLISKKQPKKQRALTIFGSLCGAVFYIIMVSVFIFLFCNWVLFANRHYGCLFVPLF